MIPYKLFTYLMKSFPLAIFVCFSSLASAQTTNASSAPVDTSRVPVTFTGGYDTERVDRGRPVILIASALNVPPEVFRQVFSGVKPAPAGQQPEPDQVRKNKEVLMEGLGPYGVTDDRLNEVSNYYRYRRDSGELWKHVEATAYATMTNGVVTSITITNPGAGYSSPPRVSIPGIDQVKMTAILSYGTDLATNGSIKEIKLKQPSEQ
jgi:hypothetical protein